MFLHCYIYRNVSYGLYPQFDDLTDEGDLKGSPDAFQKAVDISMNVLLNPNEPRPKYPYAAMLYELVLLCQVLK